MKMRLRPYIPCKDFNIIKEWIADERLHAMWCANLIQFPIEKENFERIMNEAAERFGDSPYVVTSDNGELIGFFCYSVNLETNEGMLKFVMNNPEYRGKGYGKKMLQLAIKFAFEITDVQAVHLNVFPENTRAKRCYESVGFTERKTDLNAFTYKDESWGRCNMIIKKELVNSDSDELIVDRSFLCYYKNGCL